jgi:hypothetical protein
VIISLRTDGKVYQTFTGQKEWTTFGSWNDCSLNEWAQSLIHNGWQVNRTKLDASREETTYNAST